MEGEEGAIAILNADTGAILTLASSPGYDPSIFVTQSVGNERAEALTGKPNPVLHRAYQEVYAPGSVFLNLGPGTAANRLYDGGTIQCPGDGTGRKLSHGVTGQSRRIQIHLIGHQSPVDVPSGADTVHPALDDDGPKEFHPTRELQISPDEEDALRPATG